MKVYGPDHPDYPNPPRDQARLGLPIRRSGANAVGLDWKHHAPDDHRHQHDIVAYWPEAALATTPSPDASPNSGEAEKAALLSSALNNPPAVKIGEGDYAYANIEQLPRMLREQAADALFLACEPHVTIDAWNIARMAADELEACLARPSPSPAIAKEAGEFERRLRDALLGPGDIEELAATRGRFGWLEALIVDLRGCPAAMAAIAEDDPLASMEALAEVEALLRNVRAALSASNAAQVSK